MRLLCHTSDLGCEMNLGEFVLEIECKYCKGKRGQYVEGDGRWRDCGICRGAGYVPTEYGECVLAPMSHNFRWMLKDESCVKQDE